MQDALNAGTDIAAPGNGRRGFFGAARGGSCKRGAVCTICGHHGPARQHEEGSRRVEIALWLTFLLPGLLYRLGRLATKRRVCARCGADHLVAPDSPIGRRLLHAQAQAPTRH